MARSVKRVPGYSDNDSRKVAQKKIANKIVRHTADVPNGKAYRKLYNSWNICDYKSRFYSHNELVEFVENWDGFGEQKLYHWYMK